VALSLTKEIIMTTFGIGLRANHSSKEISITARNLAPGVFKGKVISKYDGQLYMRWQWLESKNRSDLNEWPILFSNLTREEARNIKAKLLQEYKDKGYTVRTVKHYEKQ